MFILKEVEQTGIVLLLPHANFDWSHAGLELLVNTNSSR